MECSDLHPRHDALTSELFSRGGTRRTGEEHSLLDLLRNFLERCQGLNVGASIASRLLAILVLFDGRVCGTTVFHFLQFPDAFASGLLRLVIRFLPLPQVHPVRSQGFLPNRLATLLSLIANSSRAVLPLRAIGQSARRNEWPQWRDVMIIITQ